MDLSSLAIANHTTRQLPQNCTFLKKKKKQPHKNKKPDHSRNYPMKWECESAEDKGMTSSCDAQSILLHIRIHVSSSSSQ